MRGLAELAARRFYLHATPLNRSNAATALVASYFANRRDRPLEELAPAGVSVKADQRRERLIDDAYARLSAMANLNGFGLDVVGPRYTDPA